VTSVAGDGPGAPEPTGDARTWRELWRRTETVLGDRVAARWMCETAAGAFGDDFLAELDVSATTRTVQHLEAMVARRQTGEPLQYVLGHWGFRRLDLAVDRRVLIPRPETELVAEIAIERALAAAPPRRIVDLGTGSGAIGLALADELPVVGTEVWLTDVDPDALDVARANLSGIGRAATNVRVARGSWFEAVPVELCFDVVVSNPPYVAAGAADLEPVVADWEPRHALVGGVDGLDAIRAIVRDARERLVPGGSLVLEIGYDQGDAVRSELEAHGYSEVAIRPDLAGHDRIALALRPR